MVLSNSESLGRQLEISIWETEGLVFTSSMLSNKFYCPIKNLSREPRQQAATSPNITYKLNPVSMEYQ